MRELLRDFLAFPLEMTHTTSSAFSRTPKRARKTPFHVSTRKIIKAIRFPLMKDKEFAAVVLDANILTPEEIINFLKFFSSTLTSSVGPLETRRSGVFHRCGRFDLVAEDG